MANETAEKTPQKKGNGGVVIACVLIVSLLVVVAAIIILLLVYNTGGNDTENITVGQITVNNTAAGSTPFITLGDKAPESLGKATDVKPVQEKATDVNQQPPQIAEIKQQQPQVAEVKKQQSLQQPEAKITTQPVFLADPLITVDPNIKLPDFKAMDGSKEDMASVKDAPTSGGIMNAPEAKDKKWDPEKNFPSRKAPLRGENTLGAKFGPSEADMQMNLPTAEELFLANAQIAGPKYIRKGPLHKRGNDYRPIMIPKDYQDYDTVRRPNRPRVSEQHYQEAIDMQKRMFEGQMPGIIPPLM
jgi:flagellar basal body-associated protein FliL